MKIYVIGLDDTPRPVLEPAAAQVVARGHVFSGGARHGELVRELLPVGAEWIELSVPLEPVFMRYGLYDEIVVFASGDPLFFGIAVTLERAFPDAEFTVLPFFNSFQQLAHRIRLPYHDLITVSLTGRNWSAFDEELIGGRSKIGVLTDRRKTPVVIASRMVEYGYTDYEMIVGECLGGLEERISRRSVQEVAMLAVDFFAFPNAVILLQGKTRKRYFGIPEHEFEHLDGRERMITKMPIRLLTLSMLDLRSRTVFWDVGSCTGSVAVEAKLQFPHLEVEAFERRVECQRLITENARRFGTPGIGVHIGDFETVDTTGMPTPDAVFVGGHGNRLGALLVKLAAALPVAGVVVFNSVSEESEKAFEAASRSHGFLIMDRCAVQVDAYNRITVLKAVKQREL